MRSALAALLLGCSASVLPGVVLAQVPLPTPQGIESTKDIVEVGEADEIQASVGVTLSLEPHGDRTVAAVSGDTGAATVNPPSLTFTPMDFDTAQPVTVTGVQDTDTSDEQVTITLSGDGVAGGTTVTVDVTDNTPVALTLPPSAVPVTEGGTATFDVALASKPGRDTIVAVSSGDTGAATVNPPSLTFTPMDFDTAQPVTVTGVQDTDTSDEQVTITLSGDGVAGGTTVTVDVTDNTPVALTLPPSAVPVTEGGTATFDVALASKPGRDTIVAVSSGDPGVATVNPPSLTFTPMDFDTAQPVTVTGVQDTDTSNEQVTITLSGDGVVAGTVTVDVTDNDTPPPDDDPVPALPLLGQLLLALGLLRLGVMRLSRRGGAGT